MAIAVPLLWLAIGWTFAFLSVEFPVLYLAPIAIGLFMPVIRRRQHATRYKSRWSGLNILLTAVVAIALIYGSYLVIKWLAPVFLPLGGPLLLMAGFSIVIAGDCTGRSMDWWDSMLSAPVRIRARGGAGLTLHTIVFIKCVARLQDSTMRGLRSGEKNDKNYLYRRGSLVFTRHLCSDILLTPALPTIARSR